MKFHVSYLETINLNLLNLYTTLARPRLVFGMLGSRRLNSSHPSDENQLGLFESTYDGTRGFRSRRSVLPSLLQVSRQISDEWLNVLYGDNVFKTTRHSDGEYYLKTIFCDANRRRIQHIMLVLRPMGVSYRPDFDGHVGNYSSSPKNFVDSGGAASRGPLLERPYGYGEDEGMDRMAHDDSRMPR